MNLLASAWIGIIGFAIIMYVILDGFDLGIGILSFFIKDTHQRDLMISSIMPVWDGNETWLVFGGATLYGAFPTAFGLVLPALYIPILIMVCALLFRGVAFEFRLKAHNGKTIWDFSFALGSLFAAFIQGIMLGAFVQGFHYSADGITLNTYEWISPFSITCGLALIFGYILLGSNWLIAKTIGPLQKKCYGISKLTLIIVGIFAVIISLWSPFIDPQIRTRWFNPDIITYLALLPLTTVIFFGLHWWALNNKQEHSPFWFAIIIFLLCYVGFVISSWPYIVPRVLTVSQAAAPKSSLLFMLIGASIMLPLLLIYTFYSYRIFRGKVTDVIGY